MSKTNRRFFEIFLMTLWLSVPLLYAEEPSPEALLHKAVSSAFEDESPEINSAVQMAQQEIRDPFAMAPEEIPEVVPEAASQEVAAEKKVVLQGIGLGRKGSYAVMEGEVFIKGDEKSGIKLLEVRKGEVDIVVNGREVTLSLFGDKGLEKNKG